MCEMEAIEARFIIEIMGRPAEHIKLTMQNLIEKIGSEKGVHITTHKVHEPRPVEKSTNLFTTFAEMEAKFDSIEMFLGVIFAYMPSNVDVISPPNFKLSSEELGSVGNAIIAKLHMYESITKRLLGERDILLNRLKEAHVPIQPEQSQVKKAKAKTTKKKKKKN
jgi:hypothetical protein